MISKRANNLIQSPSAIMVGYKAWKDNPWSAENPNGVLNFGIAENHLVEEEVLFLANKNIELTHEHIHYQNLYGSKELRESFAFFARNNLDLIINPEKVVAQTGVTSLCESLSFCLFDEADEILVPAPYYSGFKYDFESRFNCKLIPIQLEDFKHSIQPFINAIGPKTKGILLTHPHNPLGEVLEKSFLEEILNLSIKHDLHLISDEIYTLSRHNLNEPMTGLLHLQTDYENIHYLYGMAKDFTLAGLKCGFYTTKSEKSLQAMQQVSYFHTVPSNTQILIGKLLKNEGIKDFFQLSVKRIKENLDYIEKSIPNLKMIKPKAGVFFLLDLRDELDSNNFDEETKLYHKLINELKINLTPGQELGLIEPGFFRVCYARKQKELEEFCKRMNNFLIPH